MSENRFMDIDESSNEAVNVTIITNCNVDESINEPSSSFVWRVPELRQYQYQPRRAVFAGSSNSDTPPMSNAPPVRTLPPWLSNNRRRQQQRQQRRALNFNSSHRVSSYQRVADRQHEFSSIKTRSSMVLLNEEGRIRSFNNFPSFLINSGGRLTATSLAKSCFFYRNISDEVECGSCGVIVKNFTPNDDVNLRHADAAGESCTWLSKVIFSHDLTVAAGAARIRKSIGSEPENIQRMHDAQGENETDPCTLCDRFRCRLCHEHGVGRYIPGCGHTMCNICAMIGRGRSETGETQCPYCREVYTKTLPLFYL